MLLVFFQVNFVGELTEKLHSGSRMGWIEKVPLSLETLMCYLYSSPSVNALNAAGIFLQTNFLEKQTENFILDLEK